MNENNNDLSFEKKDNNSSEKRKLLLFLFSGGCGATFLIFFVPFLVFLCLLIALGVIKEGGSGFGSSISYESECNYEETKVTVMDGSNTKVLATVSLEDYLIGVVCPEIGACSGNVSSLPEHYIKVKFVAGRTYLLARGGYNSSSKSVTIRASTRDQQWCDLKTGCIVTEESTSIFMNTYPGNYSQSQVIGSVSQKYSYTDEDLELLHKYYKDTYGDLYLPTSYNDKITSLNGSVATEYKSETQLYWRNEAASGKSYEQILDETGSSGKPDAEDYVGKKLYKLGAYCKSTRSSNGNFIDLGEYPDVSSTKAMKTPIKQALGQDGFNQLNNYIESSVKKAGYGTGNGVAAAAQSLIYGLYQKGYHLWYHYGGGHDYVAVGVDERFGTISYDCSAFVSWAIKNGCNSKFGVDVTGGFLRNYGKAYSESSAISSAKPGDLMVYDQGGGEYGHVRVVVRNNGNSVTTAESSGIGFKFAEYSNLEGKYSMIDMSSYYSTKCEKK